MTFRVQLCLLFLLSGGFEASCIAQNEMRHVGAPDQASAISSGEAPSSEKRSPPIMDHPLESSRYQLFIQQIAGEELCEQKCPQAGQPVVKTDLVMILKLHPDEERLTRILSVQAQNALTEIKARLFIKLQAYHYAPTSDNNVAWKMVLKEEDQIALDYVANLRQQLGYDDFRKLDDFIWARNAYPFKPTPSHKSPNARDSSVLQGSK